MHTECGPGSNTQHGIVFIIVTMCPNVDTLIADMPRQRLCKTMRVMETNPQLLGMMTAVKEQCVMLIRIEKRFGLRKPAGNFPTPTANIVCRPGLFNDWYAVLMPADGFPG